HACGYLVGAAERCEFYGTGRGASRLWGDLGTTRCSDPIKVISAPQRSRRRARLTPRGGAPAGVLSRPSAAPQPCDTMLTSNEGKASRKLRNVIEKTRSGAWLLRGR